MHRLLRTVLAVLLLAYPGTSAAARGSDADPAATPSGDRAASPADPAADPVVPTADPGSAPVDSPPQANETVIRAPRPVSPDRTQDLVTVSGDRLRDSPKPNLLEALAQESASIHVTRRGVGPDGVSSGAAGGLTVRGLGGSPNTQVVVVEDGVPDVQGIFGHPLPDAYVPDLLDQVAVVEGGDSVLYGSNAMGAAVVLRSRWRESDGFEVGLDPSYGSFSTMAGTAAALVRHGGWDGAFALHAMRTDGHRDGAGGSVMVVQGAGRRRFGDGWSVTLRDKAVHVTGGDPGPVQHPYTDHSFDVWRDTVSLAFEYDAPGLHVTLLPYANAGRHRLYDGFQSIDWTVGGRAEATVRLHPDVDLLAGAEVRDVDATIEDRIARERTDVDAMVDVGLWQQLAWRPLKGLTVTAGIREQHSFTYGFVLAGKGGFRWNLPRGFFVRARVSRNFRQPTIRELYLPYPVANPGLRPETSLNADAAFGWRDFRHVDVSITGFRSQARNLIKFFGAWPATESVNIDSIVVWGVEGRLAVRDLGPFGAAVSGSWQRVGRFTRQNPDAKLDVELSLGHAWGRHRIAGRVSGEWVHGLYANDYGRGRLPDAVLVDADVRYRYEDPGRGWSVQPYLVLRNLLDRRNEFIPGYELPRFHVLVGLEVGLDGRWSDP